LTFNPTKKVAPPLKRVEKKFLQNSLQRAPKEAEFCTDLKNVQKSLEFIKKGKNFTENLIFRDFLTQEFSTFLKSAQNSPLLLIPFAANFEDGAIFWKLKGQIR
jgi:hypothetical protein